VKIRPLHEIDLARAAPLPLDQKRKELERLYLGQPRITYNPFRQSIGDIFNVELGLFGPVTPVPWTRLAATISAASRTREERSANLAVAGTLHEYATRENLTGRYQEFLALPLGMGSKLVYWQPVVLGIKGRPVVPFIDPRRASKHLTSVARQFVFSVMHEKIRAADPDAADLKLAIFQFPEDEQGVRTTELWLDDGVDLFSFEELDGMVRDTYEMWQQVCQEREAQARNRAGGVGGLFDAA
jgi:hypothetical protein